MYILGKYVLRKLPFCQFPYSHFCIKAIRILRMNQNIEEPISLLLAFYYLSLIFIIFPTGNACVPADYSPHCLTEPGEIKQKLTNQESPFFCRLLGINIPGIIFYSFLHILQFILCNICRKHCCVFFIPSL